jgi:aryl-alcohol dehydrogenase-like predicted oxidoreductase
VVETVVKLAAEKDVKPAQIALAWILNKKGVVAPIIGATKMGHLEDAVAALEIELHAEEMQRLEAAYVPHPVLGHD